MSGIPFPDPSLSDGVVALRGWRPEDAPVVAAWGRDEAVVRWTGVPADYSEEAAVAWAAQTEAARKEGRLLWLAIVDAASERVIGACDLRRPDPEDPALCEMGYLLAEDARGRGLTTRAIALLVDWGFRTLRMERIQAMTHPDNPASANVLKRLGFHHEGTLRAYRAGNRAREDRIVYSLLPGELIQPGGPSPED